MPPLPTIHSTKGHYSTTLMQFGEMQSSPLAGPLTVHAKTTLLTDHAVTTSPNVLLARFLQ